MLETSQAVFEAALNNEYFVLQAARGSTIAESGTRATLYVLSLSSYAELERLLATLRAHEIAVTELSLQEADLEQVFLRIMARAH